MLFRSGWDCRDTANKGALLSFYERVFADASQSSFASPDASLPTRLLAVLSSLSQLPSKLSPEITALLHHVSLLFAPFPPCVYSFSLTDRRDGIVLGHLHKHHFPMYFLFPSHPLFSSRSEFDVFESIDLLRHVLFDTADGVSESDGFYAAHWIAGDRNALREAAACELAQFFRQCRKVAEIPLNPPFPRDSTFPSLLTLLKSLEQIHSLMPRFPREPTPELVNVPAGSTLYEAQTRLLGPLASEVPWETVYANVAPLAQLAQLATKLLGTLPRDSPGRLALGVSLLERDQGDRNAVWQKVVESASVSHSRGEVLELLHVALGESEAFHCVVGEVRAQFTREFNRLVKATNRCDFCALKLPTYRVRYLNETPVTGRVGHKNLYCDEIVGISRG